MDNLLNLSSILVDSNGKSKLNEIHEKFNGLYYDNLPMYFNSLNMESKTTEIPSTSSSSSSAFASTSTSASSSSSSLLPLLPCIETENKFNEETEHYHQNLDILSSSSTSLSSLALASPSARSQSPIKFTRRQLPARKTKEDFLHKIKRRVIIKPKKLQHQQQQKNISELKLNEIKKIYLNQNMKKFKLTNLETIYEEPIQSKNGEIHLIGSRKLRRSISLSDGLNVNKQIVKNRKEHIKKVYGRYNKKLIINTVKKINLENLLNKLNKNIDNNSNDGGGGGGGDGGNNDCCVNNDNNTNIDNTILNRSLPSTLLLSESSKTTTTSTLSTAVSSSLSLSIFSNQTTNDITLEDVQMN